MNELRGGTGNEITNNYNYRDLRSQRLIEMLTAFDLCQFNQSQEER